MDYQYEEDIVIGFDGGYAKYICDRPNLKQIVVEVKGTLKQINYGDFRKINKREKISKINKEIMDVQEKIDKLNKENAQAKTRIPVEETYIGLIERQMPALTKKYEALGVAVKLMGKTQTNAAMDTRRLHEKLRYNIENCKAKIDLYKYRIKNFNKKIEKNKPLIEEYKGELKYLQNKRKEIESEAE
jgi:chromosome segregation ATPase